MTDSFATEVDGLAIDLTGGVLRLELDRPEKRNALSDTMMSGLIENVAAAGTDERVRVIVLSGRGDHFCGGADIVARNADRSARPRTGSIQRRLPVQAHRLVPLLMTVQTPVVCAVRGLGGRHRVPARARRRLHRRRERRHLLGALHRTRLHPRQRRHLAAPRASRCDPCA